MQIADILILIGKNENLSNEHNSILLHQDNINRESTKFWDKFCSVLDKDELVFLFKGIVIVEKELKWTGGSVAAGIWIYKEINRRKFDNDFLIANWALSVTSNEYIPFGSTNYNTKNIVEYKNIKWNIFHRNEIEKKSKEINILNDKIRGLENSITSQLKQINELRTRNSIILKSNIEIANIIINDHLRPVYFYSQEIERIINDNSVDIQILQQILDKFKENEKRNTKNLKDKILVKINNLS